MTDRNAPLLAGSCSACPTNCPRSHHPNDGPCTSCDVPCSGFRDAGVCCGCDCGCRAVLTEGNLMREDVTAATYPPGESPNEADPRVLLLICVRCYTGAHQAAA